MMPTIKAASSPSRRLITKEEHPAEPFSRSLEGAASSRRMDSYQNGGIRRNLGGRRSHVASADMGERPASVKEDDGRKLRRETVEHYPETIFTSRTRAKSFVPDGSRSGRGERAHGLHHAQPARARRLHLDGEGPSVTTTEHGEQLAPRRWYATTGSLERWLTDSLGLDRACRRACAAARPRPHRGGGGPTGRGDLGDPSTCPHGNAIPGRPILHGDLFALADLEPGATSRRSGVGPRRLRSTTRLRSCVSSRASDWSPAPT